MSQPPHHPVDDDDHATLALQDPPGPPARPSPPGTLPPGGTPAEGDRVWVHLIWEAVLLFLVIGALVGVLVSNSNAFEGGRLGAFLYQTAVLGMAASGLAFSLRVGAPNLAIGGIAAAAGVVLAKLVEEADWDKNLAIVVALLVGLLFGIVLAMFVVGLHVPAWAATVGASLLTSAALLGWIGPQLVRLGEAPPDMDVSGPGWFAVFVLISLGGGALWAVPAVRARLSGTRQDLDPARRAGGGAAAGVALGLIVSSVLAAGAGVGSTLRLGAAQPLFSDNLTWLAFGAVLFGGVSVFGRRAGIAGTLLGVLLLSLLQLWVSLEGGGSWVFLTITAGAILLGLVISRLLEAAGRRRPRPTPPAPPGPPAFGQPHHP